jgi:hypothetical protein
LLELLSVFKGVESVMEHTEHLMAPELDDVLFALIEILVGLIHALEYLRDVAHVKDVVGLGGGRQEVLLDIVEQIDRRYSEGLAKILDLFVEVLEFEGGDRLKDLLHLSLCGDGIVHDVELALKTTRDLRAATTRLAHCTKYLEVLDLVLKDLCTVIPETVIHPLADELEGWVRAEGVLLGHV